MRARRRNGWIKYSGRWILIWTGGQRWKSFGKDRNVILGFCKRLLLICRNRNLAEVAVVLLLLTPMKINLNFVNFDDSVSGESRKTYRLFLYIFCLPLVLESIYKMFIVI